MTSGSNVMKGMPICVGLFVGLFYKLTTLGDDFYKELGYSGYKIPYIM